MKVNIKLLILCVSIIFSVGLRAQSQETAESILAKMTPEEKIDQMYALDGYDDHIIQSILHKGLTNKSITVNGGENKKYDVPGYFFGDGPKGLIEHGNWTFFPATLTRAASFDPELENRIGQVMSAEAEAAGINSIGAATANLLRNPKGGRAEESYGEDTYLSGVMGADLVKGIQASGKVIATAKHFALYSCEENRFNANILADERTMMEVYLPHFKRMVKEGHLKALMTSYNKINGEYASENKFLMKTVLRDYWGYEGLAVSDFVFGMYSTTGPIKVGMNMELPAKEYYKEEAIYKAIENGEITWDDIDALVLQILKVKLEVGQPKAHKVSNAVMKQHTELARESEEKSIVMLKNDNILPYDINEVKNILLVGELAKHHNMGNEGYLGDYPQLRSINPLEGMKNYTKGKNIKVTYTDGKDKKELARLARLADATIVCVGYTQLDEAEYLLDPEGVPIRGDMTFGGDRENMNLHQLDIDLINMTPRYCKNTTVVFFGAGTPVVSNWINNAPALLYAGYCGLEGGSALARIVFGDVNPSGKLPYSIFVNETDYPAFPYNPRRKTEDWEIYSKDYVDPYEFTYEYYLGYTLSDKENIPVSFPFGFGLSYTDFEINNISTDKTTYSEDETIIVKCQLKNTGNVKGAEVVQVYAGFENAQVERPYKVLKGFTKTELESGNTKTIEIQIPVKDLAYWDVESQTWKVEKIKYPIFVGNSSDNKELTKIEISVK